MNGRPSASTPVTWSGTACTIRVLRRFLSSEVGFTAVSGAISVASPATFLPRSSMWGPAVLNFVLLELCSIPFRFRSDGRGGRMLAAQETPELFPAPDGSNEQIDRPLEKGGMVAFDAMTQEQKNPAAEKQRSAQNPLHQNQKDDASENQRNADAMQKLVPGGGVLMIIPLHVARLTWHIAGTPRGDAACGSTLYTETGENSRRQACGKRAKFLRRAKQKFKLR